MNRSLWKCAVVALVTLLGASQARAQELDGGVVKVKADGSAIAVFTLHNSGMYVAYLMSATCDVAGKVEFHDATKGPAAQTYIAIEPGDVKKMDPASTFVTLTDLKRPLKDGETITITFKNEGEIPIAVTARVEAQ